MARSIRLLKDDPDPNREPPSRARHRAEHVTVGVMMTAAERDALAIRAAAAGLSMGSLLRGEPAAQKAELEILRERARREGAAEARREREAEIDELRQELAKVTADGTARARSVAAAWRAAFEVEQEGVSELRSVVQARVPLASYRTDAGRPTYLEDFDARLRARLGRISPPLGGWPKG